jgi:8-oxo-dGTP pyrophosphatase MutT (NUDIX family)
MAVVVRNGEGIMDTGKSASSDTCATLLLQRPDGTILMQLRDDGRGTAIPYPNVWSFPGGAVETDEEPIDAAIREIAEEFEIGLNRADCREIWRYAHAHAVVDHVFLCPVSADTAPVLHEGAACAWMTLTEIAQLALGFEQAKVIEFMLAFRIGPIEVA